MSASHIGIWCETYRLPVVTILRLLDPSQILKPPSVRQPCLNFDRTAMFPALGGRQSKDMMRPKAWCITCCQQLALIHGPLLSIQENNVDGEDNARCSDRRNAADARPYLPFSCSVDVLRIRVGSRACGTPRARGGVKTPVRLTTGATGRAEPVELVAACTWHLHTMSMLQPQSLRHGQRRDEAQLRKLPGPSDHWRWENLHLPKNLNHWCNPSLDCNGITITFQVKIVPQAADLSLVLVYVYLSIYRSTLFSLSLSISFIFSLCLSLFPFSIIFINLCIDTTKMMWIHPYIYTYLSLSRSLGWHLNWQRWESYSVGAGSAHFCGLSPQTTLKLIGLGMIN